MAGAILPPALAALAEALEGEGMNGVEIAELAWLAGNLRREGGSPALSRPPGPRRVESASGDDEAADMPATASGPDPAPVVASDEASGAQPTPPPRREPAAELQPSSPSGAPAGADAADTLPIHLEDPPLISQPMRLARALAPLNRLVEAVGALELDEEATVEAIARAAVEHLPWQPVLRPRKEPWLELNLVFDRSPSMAIWARLERDLRRLFSRYLRLRDVRQFHVRHGPRGPTLTTPGGRHLAARALSRADRRQLVVLVSDGCAPAWFGGSLPERLLGVWGQTLPAVLLQVFPEWMWERTALGGHQPLAATASEAMPANQALELRRLPLQANSPVLPAAAATTVPVLELDAELLAAWARLMAGDPGGIALAYRFRPEAPAPASRGPAAALREAASETEEAAAAELEHRLATFLANASPAAQRLLGLLTCAPLITLPIARLVQRELPGSSASAPASASAQLAEVLLSGLLVLVDQPAGLERGAHDTDDDLAFSAADALVYGFATPELRERLMALVTLRQARQVYDRVENAIAASLGRSVEAFQALLCAPAEAHLSPGAALLETYARVSTRVLRRLGGRWAEFGARVETAWTEAAERRSRLDEDESKEDPSENELLPCSEEVFRFSVARLQWIDALPPLPGQWGNRQQARGFLESLRPSLDLQLVEIPEGRFMMGSPGSEKGRSNDEGPQHEVKLESFFLGRTTITQAQWREVAGWVEGPGERWGLDLSSRLAPSSFQGTQRPMENVNWYEAMEFCSRLSQRSGKTYTLPSEAQWEYACRAGTATPFHYGDTISAKQANYNGRSTSEVGRFPANAWGLHDMHGNVWEWCADHWHRSYDLGQWKAPDDGSPWLDAAEADMEGLEAENSDERRRVLRGGSWNDLPVLCRSAHRNYDHPANAYYGIGFRVCCLPRGRFSSALEPLGP